MFARETSDILTGDLQMFQGSQEFRIRIAAPTKWRCPSSFEGPLDLKTSVPEIVAATGCSALSVAFTFLIFSSDASFDCNACSFADCAASPRCVWRLISCLRVFSFC